MVRRPGHVNTPKQKAAARKREYRKRQRRKLDKLPKEETGETEGNDPLEEHAEHADGKARCVKVALWIRKAAEEKSGQTAQSTEQGKEAAQIGPVAQDQGGVWRDGGGRSS